MLCLNLVLFIVHLVKLVADNPFPAKLSQPLCHTCTVVLPRLRLCTLKRSVSRTVLLTHFEQHFINDQHFLLAKPSSINVFSANKVLFNSVDKVVIHYSDVIMGAMATQITSLATLYSTVYLGAGQTKHQSSASLAFVVTRKMLPFDDVIMFLDCGHSRHRTAEYQ